RAREGDARRGLADAGPLPLRSVEPRQRPPHAAREGEVRALPLRRGVHEGLAMASTRPAAPNTRPRAAAKPRAVRAPRPESGPAPDFEGFWEYAPAPEATDHLNIQERYELFIGGQWVAPKSGKYFETINPSNEKVLAEVAEANEADVDAAVQAAERAY